MSYRQYLDTKAALGVDMQLYILTAVWALPNSVYVASMSCWLTRNIGQSSYAGQSTAPSTGYVGRSSFVKGATYLIIKDLGPKSHDSCGF